MSIITNNNHDGFYPLKGYDTGPEFSSKNVEIYILKQEIKSKTIRITNAEYLLKNGHKPIEQNWLDLLNRLKKEVEVAKAKLVLLGEPYE